LNYPRNLDKPIIAAVNGIACGGGFELVLGTDIIVMEEHARFPRRPLACSLMRCVTEIDERKMP